jgi:hypothetical protein
LADRKQQQKQTPRRKKSSGQRIEVWVSADGSTFEDEITGEENWDDLKKISAVEVFLWAIKCFKKKTCI